jgi:phosphatidylserine/phosphatidylglycerophosphate/cardiolipin synthase-like enzyme
LKHLARSLVVLLIMTGAWRYGRESVRAWLADGTRAPLASVASPVELPGGEHYSPAEDLERLDYQAIRSARQSLDIAMYSFTDILLAAAVREAGRRGVQVRIYRDGDEYEREQAQVRRHRSATQALRGETNIRICVKPPGRDYMHLKVACIDGRLLRSAIETITWPRLER